MTIGANMDFRKRFPAMAATMAVFLLLLAVRWEIVDSPPYFDFAIGIWREAEYLARTGFDYYSLRYECSHGLSPEGGPRSYMTSVVPSALAVLFRVFPGSHAPVVLYHLAVFSAAAAAAVLLFQLLRPRVGGAVALASAAAMTTTPIYCVQIDMVGFEIFLALAGLAWLWAVSRERFVCAAWLSFLAFLVKPPGALLTASLAGYLGLRMALSGAIERSWSWPLARAFAIQVVVLGGEQFLLWWGGSVDLQLAGRLSLLMALAWFPDVLVLTLTCLGAILVLAYLSLRSRGTGQESPSVLRLLHGSIQSHPMTWNSLFVIALLAVAIGNVRFVPRYATMAVPFLYAVLPVTLFNVLLRRRAVAMTFLAVTVLNLINWNGAMFCDRDWALERFGGLPRDALAREGSLLERSHEYLSNHRENLEATRIAHEQADGLPIVTSVPFNMYLAYPEFGVVARPSNVYSTFPVGGERISRIKESADLAADRPRQMICLRDTSTWFFALATMEIPMPAPPDVLVHKESSRKHLTVYRREFRPAGGRDWQQWLRLGHSFPFYTALRLCAASKQAGAAGVYVEARHRLLGQSQDDDRLRTDAGPLAGDLWAIVAAAAARMGNAGEAYNALVESQARIGLLDSLRVPIGAQGDQLDEATLAFLRQDREATRRLALETLLAESPSLRGLLGEYAAGLSRLDMGDVPAARAVLQIVLRYKSDFEPAHIALARADLQSGRTEAAIAELAKHQTSETAMRLLALTFASQGRIDAARRTLEDYHEDFPDSDQVRRSLDELSVDAATAP